MKFTKTQWKKEEIPFIMKSTEMVKNKKDYWKITCNRNDYLCIGFYTAVTKNNKSGFGKRYISYEELGKYIPDEVKKKWFSEVSETKIN